MSRFQSVNSFNGVGEIEIANQSVSELECEENMNTKILAGGDAIRDGLRKAPLIFALLLVISLVIPVSAAPALDGEGTMSVQPTNVAYGSAGNTFTFTFTANIGDFGPGSQVALIIPGGWTVPTTAAGPGQVTVHSGTCTLSGSPPFGITDSTIFVDMSSCTTGQFFTVTYAGATAPGVAGSPHTFLTQTDIGPGGQGLVDITAGSPAVTVDPAVLTVSATGLTPQNKVYDGTVNAALDIGSPTLVGVLGTDTVTLNTAGATGIFADKHVGTGKAVTITGLTLSGASAGNYTLTQPTRLANITKKPISITAVTDTRIYDGTTNSSGVPSLNTPLASGDSVTWSQTFNNRNVGTGKIITPSGAVSDGNSGLNYSYTFIPVSNGVINIRAITITAVMASKPYDGNTSSSATPILTGGTSLGTGDTGSWTQTYDTKEVGTGKTLTPAGTVTDGNGGLNYSYNFVPVTTGAIIARPITVTAIAKSKTYGAADPALTYTVSPALLTGDNLSGSLTRAPGNDVGTYAITLGTLGHPNYAITYIGADLTVTKAMLTVTANNQTINIGEPDPGFSFGYSGFMYSETLIVIDTAPTCGVTGDHTAPGKYPITCANGVDNNYDFSYVNGTLTVTAIPTLVSPSVDEHLLGNSPVTFDWADIPTAANYTIQVGYNNGFTTLLINKVVTAPASFYRANLPANKALFWRVRSFGSYGTSPWATYRGFVTANPPSVPVLSTPALNGLVTAYTPTLNWNDSVLPKASVAFGRYRVQTATDATFTTNLKEYTTSETLITDSSIVITPALDPNARYFWRVRSENSLNQYSAWSTVRYFRTALLPVTLGALPASDHPLSLRPTFTWMDPNSTAPLATSYSIQVASNSAFTTIVHTGTATSSSYTPTVNLPPGKLLYWRVHANGANGPSLWASRSFTSPTPPSVPALLFPTNNSLNTNHTPILKWSVVTVTPTTTFDHYQVQVDDDPLFGTPIVNDVSFILPDQNQLTIPSLPHNTRFYWRVLAFNTLGQYNTSIVRSFRMIIDTPLLLSPANMDLVGTLRPIFDWNDASGPGTIKNYAIQVSTGPGFGTLVVNANTIYSTYTMNKDLLPGKTYYWRVKVNGDNGPSAWSLVFSFTTP